MSMQINVDPAALTQEQREAVAGFILAYPGKTCAGTCGGHAVAEIHAHTHAAPVAAGATTAPTVNELEVLQHDHESTMPESAFGKPDEAAAAFGVPPAPLPLGATAAPSIAVAAQFPSVPAAMPATSAAPTSSVPAPPAPTPSVPAPPAPTPANVAPIAAPTPANVAPIAAPPTGSPVGGVELDKHGLPWDSRIHAGTKRKNADGSWTAKRGIDPALVATVEAELRQVMGAPGAAPLAQAPTPVAPIAPAPVSAPPVTVPPTPAVAPAPPAAVQAPGPVVNEVDARGMFVALVGRASAAIQGQKVTQAEVNQCCADAGVPALPLLANRLDLVATVASRIDALIAARGQ